MTDTHSNNGTTWKDGYYTDPTYRLILYHIEGKVLSRQFISEPLSQKEHPRFPKGILRYGDFGKADQEVIEKSRVSKYRVEILLPNLGGAVILNATLSDDGTEFTWMDESKKIREMKWISEKDLVVLRNTGDPIDALPNPYEVRNLDKKGKLLWISGAPGFGKSTSGLLLGRKFGFVYYEADAFMGHVNPYIPLTVEEPIIAIATQNFLKGVTQDRADAITNGIDCGLNMISGKEYDIQKFYGFYSFLCKDIEREQKRIGGDWVVSQAVASRRMRDHIRTRLGDNLIFVILDMSKEDQLSRIKARHGNAEKVVNFLSKSCDFFERGGEDEPRTINVLITKDMTRDDVVEKILSQVKVHNL